MLELLRNAVYLSGSLTMIGLLVLPVVFLAAINVIYFLTELLCHFRDRRSLM